MFDDALHVGHRRPPLRDERLEGLTALDVTHLKAPRVAWGNFTIKGAGTGPIRDTPSRAKNATSQLTWYHKPFGRRGLGDVVG